MTDRNPALKKCTCPSCGAHIDAATWAVGDDAMSPPKAGDIGVCLYCLALLIYYSDAGHLRARAPVPGDLSEDEVRMGQAARAQLRGTPSHSADKDAIMGLVIFDLDGTLALNDHREHFISGPGPKDWAGYFDACDKDLPNLPVIATLYAFMERHASIEIWSGRSDKVRDKTRRWLDTYGLASIPLRMRPENDHRPDVIVKWEWLQTLSVKPFLAFDDRDSVVAMWRREGITCFQVAPGDF